KEGLDVIDCAASLVELRVPFLEEAASGVRIFLSRLQRCAEMFEQVKAVDRLVPSVEGAPLFQRLHTFADSAPHLGRAVLDDADGEHRVLAHGDRHVSHHFVDQWSRVIAGRSSVAIRLQRLAVLVHEADGGNVSHAPFDLERLGSPSDPRLSPLLWFPLWRLRISLLHHGHACAVKTDDDATCILGFSCRRRTLSMTGACSTAFPPICCAIRSSVARDGGIRSAACIISQCSRESCCAYPCRMLNASAGVARSEIPATSSVGTIVGPL